MGAPLLTGLNTDAQIHGVTRRGVTFLTNGYDRGRKVFSSDGEVVTQNLGLKALVKTDDMSLTGATAGSMTGSYAGCITLFNGKDLILLESNPSPIETITVTSKKIKFTWDHTEFDSQVTKVRCYLTVAGADAEYDVMYLVGEADADDDEFEIDMTDEEIEGGTLLSVRNSAPLGNYQLLCLHKERLVLANRNRGEEVSGSADSGSTTTLTDATLKNYDTDYFKGLMITIRPGDSDEETRYISAYDASTGKVTFATLDKTVSASDDYEIFSMSGPTEVVWSEPDMPEVFPVDNVVSIDNTIMDEVTAVASFHNHIIAFGHHGAVRINAETGEWVVIPLEVGCNSPKTVVMINGALWFLANKGVWKLNPDFSSTSMTDALLEDFTSNRNLAQDRKACGCYHGRRYFLAFASGTSAKNDQVWYYDLVGRGWVQREYPFRVQSLASVPDENGTLRLYAGLAKGDLGYKIRMLDTGLSDNGNELAYKNKGTVETASTVSITDSGQSWTADEFVGAPVRVRRADSDAFADTLITTNDTTTITFDSIDFTPVAGDTYEIGVFDSELETAEMDFGLANEEKRLLFAHVSVEDEQDATSEFTVGAAKDQEPEPFKETAVTKDVPSAKVFMNARSKHFRLVIRDSSPDSRGVIRNIIAEAEVDRAEE